MILVDTSVWIDHLRHDDRDLGRLLVAGAALCHPFVITEIALGNLRNRASVLGALSGVPSVTVASETAVLSFIAAQKLAGTGIGHVDVHLLVSTTLTASSSLWTRDRRLRQAAGRLGLLYAG